ncbi:MAG: preprotein translocase subunit SecG [Clostridia bacterium]|nr:preprotein translocase subunit SecG [Clostridia bacterium]
MLDSMNSFLLAAEQSVYDTVQAVMLAFSILMVLACIAIIVVIMLQKGTADNVSAVTGNTDTFYGKNKERDKEGVLKKVTLGLFIFILVCAVICFTVWFLI